MIPRLAVGVNVLLFALLAVVYGGDVSDALQAMASEVAAMSTLPSIPFASVALAGALLGGALTALGLAQKKDKSWKGYRVMPIVAVVVLFIDMLVLSANKIQFSSAQRVSAAIEVLAQRATELSGATVPERSAVEPLLEHLGPPPWLVKGEPVTAWKLEVLNGCDGPRVDAKGYPVGTLFYCMAADGKRAWVTAVGLPREQRFGSPSIVSVAGTPLVGPVITRPPEEAPPPDVPEGLPWMLDPDAGTLGTP